MSTRRVSPRDIARFRRLVRAHYRRFGRRLPWRRTRDPYRILVSEFMLQQTQVDRVIPKFLAFVERFPRVQVLARAPQREVLRAWQGLGYNRRALMVHRAAKEIVLRHGGRVPRTEEELVALPGIGAYTAHAIRAFAFNIPGACIETNIRAVFIHHFFPRSTQVRDAVLLPLIEQTLDRKDPRTWYSALMDYGSALKRQGENPARRSAHHGTQAPFRGSQREMRGRILRILTASAPVSIAALRGMVGGEAGRIDVCLTALIREGFITRSGQRIRLQ